MPTAGYSGTPLLKKLGIKPESRILLVDAPAEYMKLLDSDISKQLAKKNDIPDIIHLFVKNKAIFETEMKKVLAYCKKNSEISVWVSWYKKSSGLATDITEDIIRSYALKNDLVDIKVCAVSELWSGLKLVVPKAKR